MQKALFWVAALSAMTLAACGSKTDANEKNFGAAISQYLDKYGDLCLSNEYYGTRRKWPKELITDDKSDEAEWKKMTALESVGLTKGEDADIKVGIFNDRTAKGKRFSFTEAAQPFSNDEGTALCWGKKALNKVEKWDVPDTEQGPKATYAYYTYKIVDVADWAKNPAVQEAFPSIKQELDDANKKLEQHWLKLTNIGWEAQGL